ncbi:hypothetical protein LEP1GSC150_1878 [Leptospira interrogans serovar Copenhageni str. LT2050]|uniref:Uncharacterized protein n=1 Tax=Leptospira interrogans serovar Copenhageni str. LT2050 TaxID=1001598 RepID=M3IKZ8_LEPIT|nr:hypothetical protein LEP1GSC150_1878 [Leptospira interrogans serovar Copenhageni str. LT2050]
MTYTFVSEKWGHESKKNYYSFLYLLPFVSCQEYVNKNVIPLVNSLFSVR